MPSMEFAGSEIDIFTLNQGDLDLSSCCRMWSLIEETPDRNTCNLSQALTYTVLSSRLLVCLVGGWWRNPKCIPTIHFGLLNSNFKIIKSPVHFTFQSSRTCLSRLSTRTCSTLGSLFWKIVQSGENVAWYGGADYFLQNLLIYFKPCPSFLLYKQI